MLYSPLRYPGGKNKLSKFIAQICRTNNIHGHYVEPYAGGASVALYLLIENYVSEITINDIDKSIYAFWYSVLHKTNKLCSLINDTDINIYNWYKQREIQKNKDKALMLDLGFSTLYLNRTNFSGVINAGVIGGLKQNSRYKIDCRFNKKELISRIRLIAKYKKHIHLYRLDALDLIKKLQKDNKHISLPTIYYFDPPYYLKGPSLYINSYNHNDHVKVSKEIKKIKNARWIVSYDNEQEIKKMYSGLKMIEYSLKYTARKKKSGNEIMFLSNDLVLSGNINEYLDIAHV